MSDRDASSKRGTRWTAEEEKILKLSWGEFHLHTIAARIGRTTSAVENHARRLDLRGGRHGLIRVATISNRTGFDRYTILRAIEHLGIKTQPFPSIEAKQQRDRRCGRKKAQRGVDEGEDYDRLVEYLLSRKIGAITVRPGIGKAPAGVWGVGNHGERCARCGTTERPHFVRGLCASCYHAQLAPAWGVKGRPAACVECGGTEIPHESLGMCKRCYSRTRKVRERARKAKS
jgi:hypothetical protein